MVATANQDKMGAQLYSSVLNCKDQPIIGYFVTVLSCELRKFWMRWIALVGNMGCERACVGFHQPFTPHPSYVVDYLMRAHVITPHLSWAVSVVKNYRVKTHTTVVKRNPS
jgi:hypothetical protein